MKQHVVNEIVNHDMCSGCGVCAGVCPSKILVMNKQTNGDLAPDIINECPPKCVLCLKVCPFSENEFDINDLAKKRFVDKNIKYNDAVGYSLTSYVGYSNTHRNTAASGGVLTWLLEALLDNNEVDAVITVASANDSDGYSLFHMQEMTTPDEVRAASGSFYYPISIGNKLRDIQELKGSKRYAVVGLPCTLKGINLAMQKMPSLRQGIRFMFGLVCGHLPNYYYTEYLSKLSGNNPDDVIGVNYRDKNEKSFANNYLFRSRVDRDVSKPVPFYGKIATAWGSRQFQLNACNFCDDLFAEIADAAFMDAWLPEYISDSKGHSIVSVRNTDIAKIFESGMMNEECVLKEISSERVRSSQESQWRGKSQRLRAQLFMAEKSECKTPKTRQMPSITDYKQLRLEVKVQGWLQNKSKSVWGRCRNKPLWNYHIRLLPGLVLFKFVSIVNRIKRIADDPQKIIRKFKGK